MADRFRFVPIPALDRAITAGLDEARRIFLRAADALQADLTLEQAAAILASPDPRPRGSSAWRRFYNQRTEIVTSSAAWSGFLETLAEIFADSGPIWRVLDRARTLALREGPLRTADLEILALEEAAAVWMESAGADFVTAVEDSTRRGIRGSIARAFRGSESRRAAARRIVELRDFGLSPQLQEALARRSVELHQDLRAGRISERMLLWRLKQRHRKLLGVRARLIARTEAIDAGNEARRQTWRAAVDAGELDADRYVAQWITRLSGVCPRCQALNLKTAELGGGLFVSDPVASGTLAGHILNVYRPTVHPGCFCGLRIVLRSQAVLPLAA